MRRIAVVLVLAFAMCGVGGAGASRTVKLGRSHRYQVAQKTHGLERCWTRSGRCPRVRRRSGACGVTPLSEEQLARAWWAGPPL